MNPAVVRLIVFVSIIFSPALARGQSLDVRIFRTINNAHTPATDRFFEFQSNATKPVVIATPVGLLATGLIRKDAVMRNHGVVMVTTGAVNYVLTRGVKAGFDRKRPYKTLDNVHTVGNTERTASFPSGHTSSAFALATSLSLAYPKWYVVVPSYLWAGTVGYSRMALGMHYPSDVLAGALLGTGSAFAVHWIRKPLLKLTDKIF